ncbi:uncharacterized protein LOC110857945 [Folsomia candida]|uniref:Down syndrome cell adhesion molecule-like protein 1 n=1 Tax=Folsomia candida TaxID=158441 RepID=A0A226DH64_FOLCA|nr:uncharacterized protein LOC110857945 [Folsomia candida]XP_021962241.1 uncharacterized protein LOC110857945 [Folsomia candida]OXA44037.1 Down syndrome cell adhesion molecule-like protein 1 [Folsomia candida]
MHKRKNIIMNELILWITIVCFVTEGAPFSEKLKSDGDHHIQLISVDQGTNFSLPCGGAKGSVMWIHEDKRDLVRTYRVQQDGSLYFPNMKRSDAGIYSCRVETDYKSSAEESVEARVRIHVRTAPLAPKNVTVEPFTISASVAWEIDKEGEGGYAIRNFQIAYRLKNATENDWQTCLPAFIEPYLRQYSIYHLQPNSSYVVKVWANNKLGSGLSTLVEMMTKNDPQEIELRKHFLDGVDSFDVRIWIIAVGIVITTLLVLGLATCCLFYREYNMHLVADSTDVDGESIELMPNIILNPGYDFQSAEISHPDENSNNTTATRVNNNSVVYPSRV